MSNIYLTALAVIGALRLAEILIRCIDTLTERGLSHE